MGGWQYIKFKVIGCEIVDKIQLAHDGVSWRALTMTVLNHQIQ
jgi:hypothetical protein